MPAKSQAKAFAPASIGNVGVGFDMLGLAVAGVGDRVTATRSSGEGVRIVEILGPDGRAHPELSTSTVDNTAGVAAAALWDAHGPGDAQGQGGVELVVEKGIPLKSGMGSSAASAVAGCVAVNALLEAPLPIPALIDFALAGERVASGAAHADNVAPSLLGGLVLSPPALHPTLIPLAVPDGLASVLLHPDLSIATAEARGVLAPEIPMKQWLAQQGYLAAFVAALATGDIDLLAASLRDVVIEPQRAGSVACFDAVKAAALGSGALGASLSGSGPSIFALCRAGDSERIRDAMLRACNDEGIDGECWSSPLNAPGARVEASSVESSL